MSQRHLSINQLAELTGKDRRTIKKKLAGLVAQAGPNNAHLYDAQEALPVLYSSGSSSDIEKEMAEESLRIERAKREKLEIEVGRLRGDLLPIDTVAKTVEKQYAYVRATVRAIPSKLAKPLSMITDPHDIFVRLSDAVDEALIELTADKNYELQQRDIESTRSTVGEYSEDSSSSDSEA